MSYKSLWSDFTVDESEKTPGMYLREQAKTLRMQSRGVLRGEVKQTITDNGMIQLDLNIVMPISDNYRYTVLTVRHSLEIYPLTIDSTDKTITCNDEKEFLTAFESILASPGLTKVITALLKLSR